MEHTNRPNQPPKKLTVLLDADLEQQLQDERAKFEREQGVAVSMNQIATRAMRDGFAASRQQ